MAQSRAQTVIALEVYVPTLVRTDFHWLGVQAQDVVSRFIKNL